MGHSLSDELRLLNPKLESSRLGTLVLKQLEDTEELRNPTTTRRHALAGFVAQLIRDLYSPSSSAEKSAARIRVNLESSADELRELSRQFQEHNSGN